jgi:hypothetical protein
MYVVPQYFIFSAPRSIIVFQQQWMIVTTFALPIGTRSSHVGGAWFFDS